MANDGVRVLVACHELVVAGGLYRFERFGRAVHGRGELAYVALSPSPQRGFESAFPVLGLDAAAALEWDATFVPGAGFPAATIDAFSMLRGSQFGVRVQHVLNDKTRSEGFERVNATFQPDVMIFNNRHWAPRDFSRFQAKAFHYLEGGVDLDRLSPRWSRFDSEVKRPFVIGGQAGKNVAPLLCAALQLGEGVVVHLFGPSSELPAIAKPLIESGRLRHFGVLTEDDLPEFYSGLDCVAHTETFAGWANVAVEAMACGVPVVCTANGTLAFAKHGATALVIDRADAGLLAEAVRVLIADRHFGHELAVNAYREIQPYSWKRYASQLLQLMRPPRANFYTWAPDLGLFGKWPVEDRLVGLEALLGACKGKTICDLGCSEGVIARRFLLGGAALVHGFERDPTRVTLARELCAGQAAGAFWQADLSDWAQFAAERADHLLPEYDIVLYLGLHHHLPSRTRVQTLLGAAAKARDWLIVRTPADVFLGDDMQTSLAAEGLQLVAETASSCGDGLGVLYTFKRLS